ncbi:thioredoxin family protein [Subsaximicrobium wynnwilliamsii]|uniref:Thioredoxin family protein n=1 Tax=Subsaximicrobium wynnwilliamsii TaxID=291179 RepID=A0A5C6ZE00_9FLAO|nr:thioredoxin family protein [Subsaximicrobium wynnwilliamsii]TXD81303.1 thioredoxin family protein [Subsaximicrobium wynnwilliamsii]TXD87328.1 thioredoxin family protein [Subsaximicrobium wynnwilliamsii]TXE00933.1 thioredoxin family protein [Subsaximicrobium wynnwilliamsii]
MARTTSKMMALGTKAPEFELLNTVDDSIESLHEWKGVKGTVIMFICNHCPFVKHVNHELSKLAKDFKPKGIECIAISSNDAKNYPQDGPQNMKQNAIDHDFIFPYLYDQTQAVAKAYDAACTPDFYAFDKDLKLVYRGQLDDSRPGNDIPVTGKDLRAALNALLDNSEISEDQKPSLGCGIKWK